MKIKTNDLLAIHDSFSKTSYGQALAARVRYEKYKPSQVSNERWIELLGPDVGNLSHLTTTYDITMEFIERLNEQEPGRLTDYEEDTLRVAALIHDWAEAIVGDISFGDKTEADEAEEKRHFNENLKHFYSGGSKEINDLIFSALTEVVFDPVSRLGAMFNAIERMGYIRTALRACGHLVNGDAQECESGFRWIIADVLSNQIIKLQEYSAKYPPVAKFLSENQSSISVAFEQVIDSTFEQYGPTQRTTKRQEFVRAQESWGRIPTGA
jgi:hypothetical protein